jgi:hypothetical protein
MLMALSAAPLFLDVSALVTAGRREYQWFKAYGRMRARSSDENQAVIPGRERSERARNP